MPFVRIAQGDRLNYVDVGRGPACVLLHGFGMQAAHFLPFVLPLAHRHRFVLIDLRGFGGSRRLRLRDPDLLLSHAQDVHEAIDALRLDRPALGGVSMGAATSLAYLRHFGFEKIRAYVHVDQAPRVLNDATYREGVFGEDQRAILGAWDALGAELEACGRDTPYARLPKRLRSAVAGKLAEFFSYAFHGRVWRASSALVKQELLAKRILDPENWPLYLDAMRAYQTRDYDFRPSLHRVSVPMHVFVGMESRMYPPAGQIAMQEQVPHARIVRFAGVGHAVPAEAPVKFTRALGEFLRESLGGSVRWRFGGQGG
jgi:pimeloyl-ACP methyl ester carboxylesterase